MLEALNARVQEELYSANLYLAMSAYCDAVAYKGFARWLRVQHEEELDHARKMLDYVIARGGKANLGAVAAPPREFGSVLQVFEGVAQHERKVTESVDRLHATAVAEKDTAAQVFLQWYVAEQVEEEAAVAEIVDKLRMVDGRAGTALYLDKEYGKRGKA